jgi:hypothetical protein
VHSRIQDGSGTRGNIQNWVPTANPPILDESSSDRCNICRMISRCFFQNGAEPRHALIDFLNSNDANKGLGSSNATSQALFLPHVLAADGIQC